jgi:hypothetical protein
MTFPTFFAPRRWTLADDERMKKLLEAGSSARSIAIQMNRSFLAVQSRAAEFRIKFVKRSSPSDHESLASGFIARLGRAPHRS